MPADSRENCFCQRGSCEKLKTVIVVLLWIFMVVVASTWLGRPPRTRLTNSLTQFKPTNVARKSYP